MTLSVKASESCGVMMAELMGINLAYKGLKKIQPHKDGEPSEELIDGE
jgi:hypothetical protein